MRAACLDNLIVTDSLWFTVSSVVEMCGCGECFRYTNCQRIYGDIPLITSLKMGATCSSETLATLPHLHGAKTREQDRHQPNH
jgi:hypothetical protein